VLQILFQQRSNDNPFTQSPFLNGSSNLCLRLPKTPFASKPNSLSSGVGGGCRLYKGPLCNRQNSGHQIRHARISVHSGGRSTIARKRAEI